MFLSTSSDNSHKILINLFSIWNSVVDSWKLKRGDIDFQTLACIRYFRIYIYFFIVVKVAELHDHDAKKLPLETPSGARGVHTTILVQHKLIVSNV